MELTSEHRKKIKKIVAAADKQTMTVKVVRRTLERSLGLEKDSLKPLKEALTAYVTLLIDPPTPVKAKKEPESDEDPRLIALKKLGRAVRSGPTLHRGLKDLDDDDARVAELKSRLEAKGYEISGDAPTAKEIKAATRKRDAQEDDGLDASNIITGKRRRPNACYAETAPAPLAESNAGAVDDDEEAEFC